VQASLYHVVFVKTYIYSYVQMVLNAAADMEYVECHHSGYILYGITACSLGKFKHYVRFCLHHFMPIGVKVIVRL
jgi:hypothetical protein